MLPRVTDEMGMENYASQVQGKWLMSYKLNSMIRLRCYEMVSNSVSQQRCHVEFTSAPYTYLSPSEAPFGSYI